MKHLRFLSLSLWFCVAATAVNQKAHAACGLEYCPVSLPNLDESAADISFEFPVQITSAGFKQRAGEGTSLEIATGLHAALTPNFLVGATGSWVLLELNNETISGAGNPMGFINYSLSPTESLTLSVGTQLEFPMSSSPATIASSHFELLPYASGHYSFGHYYSNVRVGGRFALNEGGSADGHDGHTHSHSLPHEHVEDPSTVQFVNGHHDAELLGWGSLGRLWANTLDTALFVSAQTSISSGTKGNTYITTGLSAAMTVFDSLDMSLSAELPITEFRWFDWRSSLKVLIHF